MESRKKFLNFNLSTRLMPILVLQAEVVVTLHFQSHTIIVVSIVGTTKQQAEEN